MTLESSVQDIKGVGTATAEKLMKHGIATVADVLEFFPRHYDDYSDISSIKDISPGLVSLRVRFDTITQRRVKRSLHITQAEAIDDTGRVRVVWFNQPYRAAQLTSGEYLLRGEYAYKSNRLQIVNPSVTLSSDVQNERHIVPVYSERTGVKNTQLRKILSSVFAQLDTVDETLPDVVLKDYDLLPLLDAYRYIHLPEDDKNLRAAKHRFAFEELFIVMVAAKTLRQNVKSAKAEKIPFNMQAAQEFVAQLPFTLTNAQRKVVWQIYKDIDSDEPMNRLVEGDVGSGKTVVAAMAALMALEAGKQVAVIAPTELLARQHFVTIRSVLSHTNHAHDIRMLVGSLSKKEKDTIKTELQDGRATCLIGTHAVFERDVQWQDLALVIIDEQHRFGVEQRQNLHTRTDYVPHVLCMTATPIPRSLALTVYGELDISILDEVPLHKAGTSTTIVSPNSTAQMYDAIDKQIKEGRQAYIVCPLITDSEVLDVASAEETYVTMSKSVFKHRRVGLLHGRMSGKEKDAVMGAFKDGNIDVLVSTTVIEVGVDVPNATEMVILGADRFGLAQLHQLRGRVGRGAHKGSCYLVMSDSSKPSKRMRAIEATHNGFELAEYDLEIRGAGAIYGTMQHGALDLRHVRLDDHVLIAEVRKAVSVFDVTSKNMVKYPQLAKKVDKTLQVTYLN